MLDLHHANLLLRVERQSEPDRQAHSHQVGVIAYALAQLGHDLGARVRAAARSRRLRPVPTACVCNELPAK